MSIDKTNEYPRGKLNGSDEGGINIAIGVQDKTVIVAFGTPVAWLGMDKQTALAFANGIIKKANSI